MDADARRMLADLGGDRREALSTQTDNAERQPSRQEQATIRADAQAHRDGGRAGEGSSRDGAIQAWNNVNNFEQDPAVANLENRMDGQGHRRDLNATMARHNGGNDRNRDQHNVLGVSARAGPRSNLAFAPSSPRRRPLARTRVATPPRPSRAGNTRAPSPRSFGTVRFPGRHGSSTAPNAMRSSRARNALTPAPQAANALRAAVAQEQTANTNAQENASSAQTPPANSMAADIQFQVALNQAKYCVGHTGEQRAVLVQRYPNAVPHLDRAFMVLVSEVIDLVNENDERDINRYLSMHPERQWILDGVARVRVLIEDGNHTGLQAYSVDHPDEVLIVQIAQSVFKRVVRKDSVDPTNIALAPHQSNAAGPSSTQSTPIAANIPTAVPPMPSSSHSVPGATNTPTGVPAATQESPPPLSPSSGFTNNTAVDTETSISPPVTPPTAPGSFTTTFVNSRGEHLGFHQMAVQAPVHAHLTIMSYRSAYDPNALLPNIQQMVGGMADLTNGLEGSKMANDGLWVEDEDEEL